MRAVRLRARRNQLERPVQHLYPLELNYDIERSKETKLNPETPAFRPRRIAAEVAKLQMGCIAEEDELD